MFMRFLLTCFLVAIPLAAEETYGENKKFLSVGPSGTWWIDELNDGWVFMQGKGQTGIYIEGVLLKNLDVGTNIVWGVNKNDQIYYRSGITKKFPWGSDWKGVDGRLTQVTVSPNGYVWGVNGKQEVWYRTGTSNEKPAGNSWKDIKGEGLVQISAGKAGVWAVNSVGKVFYRTGTYGDNERTGSGWTRVDSGTSMKYIAAGSTVYALSTDNHIYKRLQISASQPTGTSWEKMYKNYNKARILDTYGEQLVFTRTWP